VLENPERELPYFQMHMGWGAHFSEMGWPPFPRFYRAMMDTKRAFCSCAPAVEDAMRKGLIQVRRDQSLPAFGNCSLDDNPGSGDARCGTAYSARINAYLLWETSTLVDDPDSWEMTIWLDQTAPLSECTVDITPRRCQKFKAKAGEKLNYTITALAGAPAKEDKAGKGPPAKSSEPPAAPAEAKVLASGAVEADKFGLVTLVQARITNEKCRVKVSRK